MQATDTGRQTATVKKIKRVEGYAFLDGGREGDYFAHRSSFVDDDWDLLVDGDEVDFEPRETSQGRRAFDIRRVD